MPDFRPVSWPVLIELIGPAVAIAVIGTLQTLSIAKGLRDPGTDYNPSQETFSQGFQHLFMGFFQGCPVSNSYNKSALQHDLHGNKWSFVIAALFTLVFVEGFGSVVAAIPMPALAGCMILVGLSMMSLKKHNRYFRSGKAQFAVFAFSACTVVILSIPAAIFYGALLSIILHMVKFSSPEVTVSRSHDDMITITIAGALFFVSGAKINKSIQRELKRVDYVTASQVFIDLRLAQVMIRDQIDVDWIHKIVDLNIPITVVCTYSQVKKLETLQKRGGLPDHCLIISMEHGEEVMMEGVDRKSTRQKTEEKPSLAIDDS
jgi:MFS superfamily sulfate permease-like transporter